jgi:hypothetical protein
MASAPPDTTSGIPMTAPINVAVSATPAMTMTTPIKNDTMLPKNLNIEPINVHMALKGHNKALITFIPPYVYIIRGDY